MLHPAEHPILPCHGGSCRLPQRIGAGTELFARKSGGGAIAGCLAGRLSLDMRVQAGHRLSQIAAAVPARLSPGRSQTEHRKIRAASLGRAADKDTTGIGEMMRFLGALVA
ncbi:MAG TPA: hypothetical protein VK597_09005, partial [Inquilinus sp.]|nr:hypothetical protein [Inquilinus sp.]